MYDSWTRTKRSLKYVVNLPNVYLHACITPIYITFGTGMYVSVEFHLKEQFKSNSDGLGRLFGMAFDIQLKDCLGFFLPLSTSICSNSNCQSLSSNSFPRRSKMSNTNGNKPDDSDEIPPPQRPPSPPLYTTFSARGVHV